HYGEKIAGLAYSNSSLPRGGLPPGFPVDPDHPYWRFMGAGALTEATQRGCTLLLANGDLSNDAEPDVLAECKSALDSFGTLGGASLTSRLANRRAAPVRARLSPGRARARRPDDPAVPPPGQRDGFTVGCAAGRRRPRRAGRCEVPLAARRLRQRRRRLRRPH